MEKIAGGYFVPSAAYNLSKRQIKGYLRSDKIPQIGDIKIHARTWRRNSGGSQRKHLNAL
jgi:hypothetical protein